MTNFSIIIPNFNGASYLSDCIPSLYKAIKNCPNSNFEIILVDNASKDNSLDLFKNLTSQFKINNINIFSFKNNQGFAKAVNLGIKKSKFDWVVICNNDLTIKPNWFNLVSKAIESNENHRLITFFGTVLNKDGTKIESQGLDFFIKGKAKNINNGQVFFEKEVLKLKAQLVWGASAALVVYNKNVIQKIGLFDSDFFAYEEDVDLALRLDNLNYKTLYIPQAISYHLGGGTSNKMGNFRNQMDAKNWIYLIIKNYSSKQIIKNFFPIFEERLRNLSGLIKSTIKKYKLNSIYRLPVDLIKTYGEVLIKLPSMLNKRKRIQKLIESTKL